LSGKRPSAAVEGSNRNRFGKCPAPAPSKRCVPGLPP